ncbi:sensor histidine kinase [Kocuria sp.]|uniref:sensor histidine kinase n=1 Tax=Kocuria sp. TaxID=1871328 RepID=UPI0026E04FC6|nr:histidine kinase [Kocuria sp.]MDO5366581.1 histidine kinase [Kocuria sp.]
MARFGGARGWVAALSDPDEPDWQRPRPTSGELTRDVWLAVGVAAASALSLALISSYVSLSSDQPWWLGYLAAVLIAVPLAVRRRFPVAGVFAATAVFVWTYYTVAHVSVQLFFQIAYFASLYSMVAWARSRQVVALMVVGLAVFTVGWLMVDWTVTNSYSDLLDDVEDASGPFSPTVGIMGYSAIMNVVYFGGALVMGRSSWRRALDRRRLREQAWRIAQQSEQLANRAVVEERLRIARELHDVVAHHVSAIGIQAGAARTVMTKNPQAAAEALSTVEDSSRQAVTEMRELLGVLRAEDGSVLASPSRTPEPRLSELDELVASHTRHGLTVTLNTSLEHPEDLTTLPGSVQLTVYRCLQEALANVTRHSTAREATAVVRTGSTAAGPGEQTPDAWVELEITDRGQPLSGTGGSGFGLKGIAERARLYNGVTEIGPRTPGPGWRVRVRIPRSTSSATQEVKP